MQMIPANELVAPSTSTVCRADPLFRDVTELHTHGGAFTSIGGDMINNVNNQYQTHHHHHHHHAKPSDGAPDNPSTDPLHSTPNVDVLALLKAVSNQRKIQQDTFGKATPKTGEWMLTYEKLAEWQDPTSGLNLMCGSGIREYLP
jgi:hypothetical protein